MITKRQTLAGAAAKKLLLEFNNSNYQGRELEIPRDLVLCVPELKAFTFLQLRDIHLKHHLILTNPFLDHKVLNLVFLYLNFFSILSTFRI